MFKSNEETWRNIEKKLKEDIPNALKELDKEKVETSKSLKEALTSLAEIEGQVKVLGEERDFNY